MGESESELTEEILDQWTIIGIVCAVILGGIAIVVLISLLIWFVWRRKNESTNERKAKFGSRTVPNGGSNVKNPNSYGPVLGNYTESYYVQPNEQHTLAPSAEMLHYQYQKDRTSNLQPYPDAYQIPQPPGGNDDLLEIPGLAPQQDVDIEVTNPLYEK